jgi:hypothetical protein
MVYHATEYILRCEFESTWVMLASIRGNRSTLVAMSVMEQQPECVRSPVEVPAMGAGALMVDKLWQPGMMQSPENGKLSRCELLRAWPSSRASRGTVHDSRQQIMRRRSHLFFCRA